jgi:hypothetical protein
MAIERLGKQALERSGKDRVNKWDEENLCRPPLQPRNVNARDLGVTAKNVARRSCLSLRGALATEQSSPCLLLLDCFASLAMTVVT